MAGLKVGLSLCWGTVMYSDVIRVLILARLGVPKPLLEGSSRITPRYRSHHVALKDRGRSRFVTPRFFGKLSEPLAVGFKTATTACRPRAAGYEAPKALLPPRHFRLKALKVHVYSLQ
jgi:hypothetical protein